MPYNPGISYNTPAQKTGQAMNTLGAAAHAVGEGVEKARQTREEAAGLGTVAQYLAQTQPDLMTEERLAQFESGNLGAKKALLGEISVDVLRKFETDQKEAALAARNMPADELERFEGRTGYTYINGQVVPLKGKNDADEPQFFTDPTTGERFYQSGNAVRQVRRPTSAAKPLGVAESAMVGSLTQGIADIDNQIAQLAQSGDVRGKRGPNWLPGRTRQEEMADLEAQKYGMQAQLEGLQRGGGGGGGRAMPSAQAGGLIEEARAAVEAGADPVAVAARLRQMGVDPAGL